MAKDLLVINLELSVVRVKEMSMRIKTDIC